MPRVGKDVYHDPTERKAGQPERWTNKGKGVIASFTFHVLIYYQTSLRNCVPPEPIKLSRLDVV